MRYPDERLYRTGATPSCLNCAIWSRVLVAEEGMLLSKKLALPALGMRGYSISQNPPTTLSVTLVLILFTTRERLAPAKSAAFTLMFESLKAWKPDIRLVIIAVDPRVSVTSLEPGELPAHDTLILAFTPVLAAACRLPNSAFLLLLALPG